MNSKTQASIFEYNDYRKYLADFYSERKLKNPSYSHRVFANQAGLSSPSHLLMIIKGDRNLSMKTIEKFADGMRLSKKEKRYFELIVLFNQTDDLQTKAVYFGEMMSLKISSGKSHDLEREKFNFLSKWYVVAIYVLIDLKDFCADPFWIAKRLGGKITSPQAKEAIEDLLALGMIQMSTSGVYTQTSGSVTVQDDTKSVAVFDYHKSMIRLASEALRMKSQGLREMNGATIAIPKEKLPELKERIRAFRKEMNRLASSYENPDEVYQLNIQLFPLTESEAK